MLKVSMKVLRKIFSEFVGFLKIKIREQVSQQDLFKNGNNTEQVDQIKSIDTLQNFNFDDYYQHENNNFNELQLSTTNDHLHQMSSDLKKRKH